MKKVMSLVVALVATVALGSSAFAASTFKDFTAAVAFTGGEVSFNATLQTGSSLTWDTTKINIGQTTAQWKPATAYIQMEKTITKAGGKVYFYQDNKATGSGDTKYVATKSRTEVDSEDEKPEKTLLDKYNGLVKGSSGGGNNGYIAMNFKVSTVTLTTPDMTAGTYGTRYLTDKSDTRLKADKSGAEPWSQNGYCMIANAGGYVEDVDSDGNPNNIAGSASVSTGYLYIGANFINVMGGDSYGSNHIKFEVVNE